MTREKFAKGRIANEQSRAYARRTLILAFSRKGRRDPLVGIHAWFQSHTYTVARRAAAVAVAVVVMRYSPNIAAMWRRWILPVAVRGSVSITCTRSGTLNSARLSPQKARMSSSELAADSVTAA